MSDSAEPTREDLPETDEEWRERLTDEEYRILRERGTEARFSGDHVDRKDDGVYKCAGCGTVVFESETKYDSGCGWPSFYAADESKVRLLDDDSHGMSRVEVRCSTCDGHLGHVFQDGPEPTGERFCINSVAIDFEGEA
ncbi:peptide-methionine (R)-S-oxide reductase MsrB [Halobaculum lipolyticum]|uniref:peptide-methionine (R)-S-oxide reductase n=1 Tax=Halobaculum lipolyticum TaxID=3032001 RepID=A0ABD5WBT3_9EURY|nr:peptide-methionine (R)-S-oxide reductase MsrB [Halobaculum sp. DT31]